MRTLRPFFAVIIAAATPVHAQTPPPPTDQVIARLSQITDSLAQRDEFSGVVVLMKDGNPVFEKAYGYANRETKQRNTLETQFDLGSINKIFTSTSIRQLVSAGKIVLDSTISYYLPDYPNPAVAKTVTVQQLVSMRAGLGGDIFGTPASGRRADIRKLADFLPLFAHEPPAFAPGSRMQYCNACFVVLGLIIEKVSGQSYYDYVRTHIYDPAGMTHTAHLRSDALPNGAAIGYTRGGADAPSSSPIRPNTLELPGIGSSAGGGYSTARDLLQFVAALRAKKIPNGQTPGSVGIAGGAPGMNAALEGGVAGVYDLVVLSNLDPPSAERISRLFRQFMNAS